MKGTELDTHQSRRQLSEQANRERELGEWMARDDLEIVGAEVRAKRPATTGTASLTPKRSAYKLPDEGWD
jgi:hypothetical protein